MIVPDWVERLLAIEPVRAIPYETGRGLLLYTALLVGFLVLERLLGNRIDHYRNRSVRNDFIYCIFYNGGYFTLLVWPILKLAERVLEPYRVDFLTSLPVIVAIPLFFVMVDFAFYWAHRLLHTKYFWPFHSVHHSQKDLTVLTTARFHIVDVIVLTLVTMIPATLLGFPTIAVAVTWLTMMQDKVQHANLGWTYGPLYNVIVSPRYHRIHHAADAARNHNFGRLFAFWDRVFGTANQSRDEPSRFGIEGVEMPESIAAQFVLPFREVWRVFRRTSVGAPLTPARLDS